MLSSSLLLYASNILISIRRNHVLSPDSKQPESLRTPTNVEWLQSVALRDIVLDDDHAACIDAKGDVYQWGDGFFGSAGNASGKPLLTLRGKVCEYSLRSVITVCVLISSYHFRKEHYCIASHTFVHIRVVGIWEDIRPIVVTAEARVACGDTDACEYAVVGDWMDMGRGGGSRLC